MNPAGSASSYEVIAELMRSTELTRDALPYTDEFERLYAEFGHRASETITRHRFWRMLSNAAKRGGWKGKQRGEPGPELTHQQEDILRGMLTGKLGSRDGLAYTTELGVVLEQFNSNSGLSLTEQQLWRAIGNISKRPLRPDVEPLLIQGVNSVVLAIEHFNRPSDRGRLVSVLIMFDHACEMLLKAALLQRGGDIRNPKTGYAHSFEYCINKAADDATVKFLSDDERRTLRALNGLRDQAQHYLVDVSEAILYTVAQGTVTLFADLMSRLFGRPLSGYLPDRVLPVSINPPRDIQVLMDEEFSQLRTLLTDIPAEGNPTPPKLRSLVTIDRALNLEPTQVSDEELASIRKIVIETPAWQTVFHGIAQVQLRSDGTGIPVALHITKKDGLPVRIVTDGEFPDATVAIRKVNDTDFYCYNTTALAKKSGLSVVRVGALIRYLRLKEEPDAFKEITIGRSHFKMYSAKALNRIKEALPTVDMEQVWRDHRPGRREHR
jgi:hypothetical protein